MNEQKLGFWQGIVVSAFFVLVLSTIVLFGLSVDLIKQMKELKAQHGCSAECIK